MRYVTLVTGNFGKFEALETILREYDIGLSMAHTTLPPELRSENIREVAAAKAKAAFEIMRVPLIVHDGAFFIPALNGFPNTFVNFALKTIELDGILKLLEGKPRECEYRHCLGYYDGTSDLKVFESTMLGSVANAPRGIAPGNAWSPLCRIFVPEGYAKTHAQLSKKEYREWREKIHQDSYLAQFATWYNSQNRSP